MKIFYFTLLACLLVSCAPKYTVTHLKKPVPKVYDIKPIKIVDVSDLDLDIKRNTLLQNSLDYLAPLSIQEPEIRNKKIEETFDLDIIYFDYDSYDIKQEEIAVVKKNATWLKMNTKVKILIEGHTDQLGSNEYNLSLSQHRASSVRAYLAYLGVDPRRIATISYGEEKLAVKAYNKQAYAKNRRAKFLLLKDKPE
ncbi:MAG: OmpA family protein [bacterium]|nr:OmpA family protein [bacterium]